MKAFVANLRAMHRVVFATPADFQLTEEGRAAERQRRIILTGAAAALAKAISVGTMLVTIPMTFDYLGPERYGIWLTMSSVMVFLGFADLGIGYGLLNAISSAFGNNDLEMVRINVTNGLLLLSSIALAVISCGLLAHAFMPWAEILNATSELARRESGPAMLILAICFGLSIPINVVQKIQLGLQMGFVASLWQCAGSMLGLIAVLIAIRVEAGLAGLALAMVGAPLLAGLLNSCWFFLIKVPDTVPRLGCISVQVMMQLLKLGSLFLVLQLACAVAFTSDAYIISRIVGPAAVPVYGIPEKMFSVVGTVLAMLVAPLWPAYSEAAARGDQTWVRKTLYKSILASATLSAAGSLLLLFGAQYIFGIWIGKGFDPPFLLLAGFALWKTIEATGNAVAIFLNAMNVVKFQVVIATAFAAMVLPLKIVGVKWFGVQGAVWSTAFAYILFICVPYCLVVPALLSRKAETWATK